MPTYSIMNFIHFLKRGQSFLSGQGGMHECFAPDMRRDENIYEYYQYCNRFDAVCIRKKGIYKIDNKISVIEYDNELSSGTKITRICDL